jgi:hypothetical protein
VSRERTRKATETQAKAASDSTGSADDAAEQLPSLGW